MTRIDSSQQTSMSIKDKIKGFVHRKGWHELLIFSFFALLSFGFWLLQSLQQDYEIEVKIPIKYKNIPDSVYFTTPPPEFINLKLKDKGSVLLNYTMGRKFKPIDINMGDESMKKGSIQVPQQEIRSDIMKQLLSSTNILAVEPNAISINYVPLAKKNIQVIFNGLIHTAEGFLLVDSVNIDPSEVTVYAKQSVLDTLNSIQTDYTLIENLKNNFSRKISLISVPEASFNPSLVTIKGVVEEFTEKTLEVPITCINIPEEIRLRTFPSSAKITCSIPITRFKELKPSDFIIDIDFHELEENINGQIKLNITSKPDWVKQLSVTPEKIEFILERKNSND